MVFFAVLKVLKRLYVRSIGYSMGSLLVSDVHCLGSRSGLHLGLAVARRVEVDFIDINGSVRMRVNAAGRISYLQV